MALQAVELLYGTAPSLDIPAIGRRVEQLRGAEVDTHVVKPGANGLIFHKDQIVQYDDGAAPAQTALFVASEASDPAAYEEEVQQSWACERAAELMQNIGHTCLVAEMMAQALAPARRLEVFHAVLQAAVEVTRPTALAFKQSQQILDPAQYLAAATEPPIRRPGSLNVRFYNISNSPGDMIMDTRGLEEIGLHDLQCHFRELEPNEVSRVLYNTAFYVFEKGPVIESGHTIAGIEPESHWRCQFEEALLPPGREVLDLDPGPPYAAGTRPDA